VIIKIFLTSSSQTDNRDPKTKKNKESKKPNYDDEDQLKEEAGEQVTINQIFKLRM
jgi:hypothetical protein